MAWNTPGGSGDKDKDPWGQRRKSGSGSPDLDQIVRNIQQKLSDMFGGRPGGGRAYGIGLILAAIVGLWLLSGVYIVQQGERAVILRFGAKNDVTLAGLHWRLPYPIESVEKVNVEKVSTIEVGYRSNVRGGKSKVPKEALMLTGDENIIDIEFAVQYKVKDAGEFLFNVRDPEVTISQATESAVREVVGKNTLDFALTEGRDQMSVSARELLQQILDRYKTGIEVVTVETQKAQPPEEVKTAFDDAVKAREDEQRLKNEAEADANDIIPRARGAAARLLQEADGYKAGTIARAEGDARRFSSILKEYVQAPAVTRERLYIEAMEQMLSNTTKIYVDQKGGNNLLYLPLDKLVPRSDSGGHAATPSAPEAESATPSREPAARGRVDSRRRSGGQP